MTTLIKDLVELARREDLDPVLAMPAKPAHLALRILPNGKIKRIEAKSDFPVRLPWPAARTSGANPNILYDNPTYIFGVTKFDLDHEIEVAKTDKDVEAAESKRKRMVARKDESARLHTKLAACCPGHQGLAAVVKYFEREQDSAWLTKLEEHRPAKKGAEIPDLVFYLGEAERPICEDPEVYEAIGKVMQDSMGSMPIRSIFGDHEESLSSVHAKVRLPGLKQPCALVSFDASVARVYPLVSPPEGEFGMRRIDRTHQMAMAPMDYMTMRSYTSALTWLGINQRLTSFDGSLGKITYLAWTPTRHRFEAVLKKAIFGPYQEDLGLWQEWMLEHLEHDHALLEDETPLRILEVSCKMRISVRSYTLTTVGQVARNLIRYRKEFVFHHATSSLVVAAPPGILMNMYVGHPKSYDYEMLMDAILLGAPRQYPATLAKLAMGRLIEGMKSEQDDILASAVLNAYTSRANRSEDMQHGQHYLAGRLFQLLVERAYAARDPADQPSIPRQVGRVAQNPAANFPPVLALSEKHARKLERRGWYNFAAEIGEVFDALELAGGMPGFSTAEQQTRFFAGLEAERRTHRLRRAARIEQAKQAKQAAMAKEESAVTPEAE